MQKEIDPTPLMNQVFVGCTQRDAKVDLQAVQSKTELFNTSTTTREADGKDQTKENKRHGPRLLPNQKGKGKGGGEERRVLVEVAVEGGC